MKSINKSSAVRFSLLAVVTFLIFLVPNLFWGGLYQLGGDDGRIYYLFPSEYLTNLSFNIISSNNLGGNMDYLPISFTAPLMIIMTIIKALFPLLNTQFVIYGLLFSASFLVFFAFLGQLTDKDSQRSFLVRIICSVFYILSPFITETFFQHQLITIFSILVFPACMLSFVLAIKRRNYGYAIIGSVIYSVFSTTVYGLPWLLPAVLTSVPLLVYFALKRPNFAMKATGLFILLTVLINMYWLIHLAVPVLYPSDASSFVRHQLSAINKEQNNEAIAAIAGLNTPYSQMTGIVKTSWEDSTALSTTELIGIIYILIILLAGSRVFSLEKNVRVLYAVSVSSLLLAMYFFTPNFGESNLKIFQELNLRIPLFVMFRNMYDKFALAMSFHYAAALYLSLVVLARSSKQMSLHHILLGVVVIVTIVRAAPYVVLKFEDAGFSTRISGTLNKDFIDLTEYMKGMDTTHKFLWLPMTYPGYVYLEDENNDNHFYSGVSPVQILAGKNDIAGFYGIQTPLNRNLNAVILEHMRNREYDEIGKYYRDQNIGYIIENSEPVPEPLFGYYDENGIVSSQSAQYKENIVGDAVAQFGDRYTLYTIADEYLPKTVFLTDQIKTHIENIREVEYRKTGTNRYTVHIDNLSNTSNLVFLEPYSPYWTLFITGPSSPVKTGLHPKPAYDYGNAWTIDPDEIIREYPEYVRRNEDGSYALNFDIHFWPEQLVMPSIIFSLFSGLGGLCVAILMLYGKRR